MNTLKLFLKVNHITIFEFANRIGVTRQAVHKWMRATDPAMPTPRNIKNIHHEYPAFDVVVMVGEIARAIIGT